MAGPSALPVNFSFDQSQPSLVAQTVGLEASGAVMTMVNNAGVVENSAAANGRFDIVIRYTRRSDLPGGFHPGGGAMVADHHRRHSGLQLQPYGLIDDLLIDASIVRSTARAESSDRPGRTCCGRGSRLPAHGEMEFDSADVATMFANGT